MHSGDSVAIHEEKLETCTNKGSLDAEVICVRGVCVCVCVYEVK